jgi:hypothetical protein
MKRVAWVGAVAVVVALAFGGYAVADSSNLVVTNLVVTGSTQLAGPLLFYGGGGYGSGGPMGEGLITEGHRCSTTQLVTSAVDSGSGPDYHQVEAFVTLRGFYPGTYVLGTVLLMDQNDENAHGLRVCLSKAAPLHGITFNYFIANVSWDN